ncbi:MAG: hypothetical protein R3F30_07560 [Planctomycetota bacterium]
MSPPALPSLRRSRLPVTALVLAALAAPTPAQTKISYSRLAFCNGYRVDRPLEWPSFRSSLGNDENDLVFRMLPREVLRGAGKLRVSGIRWSYTVADDYQGSYPSFVQVPTIGMYPLVNGQAGLLPDFPSNDGFRLDPGFTVVPKDGVLVFELRLGPGQFDPGLKSPIPIELPGPRSSVAGWAIALHGIKGEKANKDTPNMVPVPSYNEVHRQSGLDAYSGLYDARLKRYTLFGRPGAPPNSGEVGIELLVDGPTLQVFSDASGGLRNDPRSWETHKGVGAYFGELASAATQGWFGLYAQWEGRSGDGLWAFPIVAAGDEVLPLPGGVELLWSSGVPSLLTALVEAGLYGPVGVYKAQGVAGHDTDQDGVWHTARIPVPQLPALRGLKLSAQALFVEAAKGTFEGVSNAVTIVF